MTTNTITVVGSLNMDLIVRAPHLPAPGETVLGDRFYTAPGGKGANQAVATARLGASVTMVGRVGRDTFGEELRATLTRDGVDVRFVRVDDEQASGVALIALDANGQNNIIVASGANMHVKPADVEAADEWIRRSQILLLQLEIPLEANLRAVELARAAGVPVVLNPAPARALPRELLSQVDYLIPNESEASLLSGVHVHDLDSARQAAQALRQREAGTVIVTLGEKGALLVHADSARHAPGFAVDVVDTTAAGDAFIAGFAVAMTQGKSLEDAVRFANAAGALATTRLGAQPSLPTLAEVQALLGAG